MLKSILTISGKPGLYKLLTRGRGVVIVEAIDDTKKRFPIQGTDKVVTLGDISVFTHADEKPLRELLTTIQEKEGGAAVTLDFKNGKPEELKAYFSQVLPDYDEERFYVTHMRKILSWYNILVKYGLTDFSAEEKKEEPQTPQEAK